MLATSSRCSFRNQSRNCAPTRSFSSRASAARRLICAVTCFSCSSASLDGRDRVRERGLRLGDAGIVTGRSASRRYWTIMCAWFRSSTACR